MSNVIDFEEKKQQNTDNFGLNVGLKIISMPSLLKDNLAASYHELTVKMQTIIDLLSNNKSLNKEHLQTLSELKAAAKQMKEADKHYVSILQAAKKAGYYNDWINTFCLTKAVYSAIYNKDYI